VTTSAADALNAQAYNLMLQRDYPTATYWLRRALDMDASNVHARNNLATCLKQLGREDEAIKHYEALIGDAPDFLYAVNNLAFSYLRKERYADAWRLYHSRRAAHLKIVTVDNPLTGKPFKGEPAPTLEEIRGKDVLLVLEQGIGDEMFFLRFVPKLIELGQPASVWYAPGVKLYPLLAGIRCLGMTLTDSSFSQAPKGNAVAIPIADLPLVCGHDGSWFPPLLRMGYDLPAPTEEIGVTWRGGDPDLVHKGGTGKQCPPEELGRALRGVPGRVVVMQRNPSDAELAAFSDGYGSADFDVYHRHPSPTQELAALIERLASLKTYVGVSNTDMYLLALIGRTAHTLVIHPAEWRWLGPNVPESPWFPGFKRYHQNVLGWGDALEQVREALLA
jgi:hypothetical protein